MHLIERYLMRHVIEHASNINGFPSFDVVALSALSSTIKFPCSSLLVSKLGFSILQNFAPTDSMEGTADWEMLLSASEEEDIGQGGVTAEAEGLMMLRLDYFSIDSGAVDESDLTSDGRSVESDNPSWVDPAESDAIVLRRRDSGEFWPDSGSDRSKMSDCGEKLGLGFVQNGDDHVFELENQRGHLGQLGYGSSVDSYAGREFEGVHEVEKMSVVSDDSVENMVMADLPSEEVTNETEMGIRGEERCVGAAQDGNIGKEVEQLPVEEEKKAVIWWKVPLELVKFCVFRVSPLWSISVAAAMVGMFIMRRRLHNMKRKTKSLQMKVTVDHKKVDQFMSRAARLNEAFSVVRLVPIIRPSLPAAGVAPWPAMSLW